MRTPKSKSILTGLMLTAGTSVGAGMFSLPVVSSGMWFGLSVICLMLLWYLSYLSALYLLEVNMRFLPGASFDTIVKDILGKNWNTLAGLSITFLLYILLYAYYSAFGSVLNNTLDIKLLEGVNWSQGVLGLLFGGILAAIVWSSTKLVGRISTLLVIAIIVTFILSMSGFAMHIELSNLFNRSTENNTYAPYVWAALPYFMTSYGFSSIVPSLYKYYGKDHITIRKSMLFGSLIALFVYCLFLFVIFGNISRDAFLEINKLGGNIGILVDALIQSDDNQFANTILTLFSNFAIISSFLGVGLCLLDYILDLFSFPDNPKGRLYGTLIAFLPSGILSLFFPHGFIAAIGFAGLVHMFGLFIIPYLMVKKTRKRNDPVNYRVSGGSILLNVFVLSSIFIAIFHILAKFNYLPVW